MGRLFYYSYEVEHTFIFGAELFHASHTTSFIVAYVNRVLIEGFEMQDVLLDLLEVSPQLASHSSVIHLHLTNAFRRRQPTVVEYNQGSTCTPTGPVFMKVLSYTFFHENVRPWGNALPYQCPSCKCVRSWQRMGPRLSDESRFVCKGSKCSHVITYVRPKESNIIWTTKKTRSTPGSGWLLSAIVGA